MKKGFTLVEVLVSSCILSASLASMLFSYVTCHSRIIQSTHINDAAQIINQHFEDIQNRETDATLEVAINPYYTKQRVYTTYNQNMTEDYWLEIQRENVVFPYDGSDLSVITATVTWEDGGPGKSLSMSIISNEPN